MEFVRASGPFGVSDVEWGRGLPLSDRLPGEGTARRRQMRRDARQTPPESVVQYKWIAFGAVVLVALLVWQFLG